MKVCEIFESIQGEGRYVGVPALFIRLSNCTRSCHFCDSKYHKEGKEMSVNQLIKVIEDSSKKIIVFTGGEPLLQLNDVVEVIKGVSKRKVYHLESNGDLVDKLIGDNQIFYYICFSPKDEKTAIKIRQWEHVRCGVLLDSYDIKVVTDLEVNKDLIPYATILMPLTVCDDGENMIIRRNVWNYCVEHNIKYSPRLHVEVWGVGKRKV